MNKTMSESDGKIDNYKIVSTTIVKNVFICTIVKMMQQEEKKIPCTGKRRMKGLFARSLST